LAEPTDLKVRIVDESGNAWPVDVGVRYLLDLRAVIYTGFRVGWNRRTHSEGGVLVQQPKTPEQSTDVLQFVAQPREPDLVVPWESNLVYAPDEAPALGDIVVVPTSRALFEAADRTLRSGEDHIIQADLIAFHDARGAPIRLPDTVRSTYDDQMRTVNGYRNAIQAMERVERQDVDTTIEEHLLDEVDAACATLHVIAPFLAHNSEAMTSRSIALPGPPVGGEAILRIVLTSDLGAVTRHLSGYHQEIERELPDPQALERLDNSLMELIWERFIWADNSEERIEDLLTSTSPFALTT